MLRTAALSDKPSMVVDALMKGANINAQNAQGMTALIFAALMGHDAIVAQLIAAGANVNAQDEYGKTALDYAKERGYKKNILMLKGESVEPPKDEDLSAYDLLGVKPVASPYEILGVSRDATSTEISRAYKDLSLKWHPDKNPDDPTTAEEVFKIIGGAYQEIK